MGSPLPGTYSGNSTLALVARASAFTFGLVYRNLKLKVLKAKAESHAKTEAKAIKQKESLAAEVKCLREELQHVNMLEMIETMREPRLQVRSNELQAMNAEVMKYYESTRKSFMKLDQLILKAIALEVH